MGSCISVVNDKNSNVILNFFNYLFNKNKKVIPKNYNK
jgi:hypothetical protein